MLHPNRKLLTLLLYQPMENHLKCFPGFLLEIHNFLQRRAVTPTLFSHFNVGFRIYAEIFILINEKRPNHVTRGFPSPRIKVRTDWHGLPMWLLSSRRIITFKLYFSSHKRDFPFLKEMIGGFVKIAFSKGWLQCSIDICFKFLTAEWYVVTFWLLCMRKSWIPRGKVDPWQRPFYDVF